jgi:hypothetical protein
MHRIPWILAGLLLTRLLFVEAAAPLSVAPVAALPPLRVSSTDFHAEPWLDFNLLQSGHLIDSTAHRLPENHTLIVSDYA